ncbi:hypothetical protein [Cohnella lubricantis]|uniref:Uncharacterized protein n=1 Tax=Cohnella lubricantis TaxID=2163172 RepID=A0A841TMJ2_9BACL|nr:hypothetical protein [Cohnella lubricantis]MBB6679731.1 hypothetical protein [Cohnella lubricantis]MBP2120538.1 hypothetical protein [Cohnella lubricantis]
MREIKKILVSICILFVLFSLYLNSVWNNYLFTPFNFVEDDITVGNWKDYKEPIQFDLSNIDEGWKTKTIENTNDIKYIIKELKRSNYSIEENINEEGTHFVLTLRRVGKIDNETDGVLLQFKGSTNGIINVNNQKEKYMTESLKDYIKQELSD